MWFEETGGGAGGQDASQDGATSGGADTSHADDGSSDGSQGGQGAQGGGGGAAVADFEGLPFKDTKSLAQGFKDLQRSIGAKDRQYKTLNSQVQALVRQLGGQLQHKPAAEVTKEDADAFLKRFLADPQGTLSATAKELFRTQFAETVEPRFGDIASLKNDRSIDRFLQGDGKDLNPQQQGRFLEILDENPWMLQSPDPLKACLNQLVAEDPAAYSKAVQEARDRAANDLNSAKGSAGLGGKRTSNQQGGGKDAFDQVLALNKGSVLRI